MPVWRPIGRGPHTITGPVVLPASFSLPLGQAATPVQRGSTVRTDMHCHQCGKSFLAELDATIAGNQVLECPWCRHEHLRSVKGGVVTEHRWASADQRLGPLPAARTWKHATENIATHSTAEWLRHRWLNPEEA